ncbi:ATP-dependent Clp protease proteolytic subunit [Chloroflexi bacterium TSY]|nr:ATP-dependent Clp protease proteolytic subunit [Chloroflexi bacterium TSY]
MNRKITWFRVLYLTCFLLGILLSLTAPTQTRILARSDAQDGRVVYVLTFEGPVTPVLEQYIVDNIEEAQLNGVDALILELDTPGGSVDVTKSITQKMLVSPIPIIVYVAPLGAHAGSAGTFITLAGHAAAMAPGSSIGAASPITSGGQDIGETLEAKVENMLSADIENLASRRGEDAVEWAIAAVREAEAATAEQALELGVIDVIAQDVPDLLEQLDGFDVEIQGETQPLEIRDAFIIAQELNPIQRLLHFIADPTIASLLFSLGSLGLILELRSPGFGVPGIVGFVYCSPSMHWDN